MIHLPPPALHLSCIRISWPVICSFCSWLCGLRAQGNINLIDAAAQKGVKKFVLLTSIGTGDSQDAPPKQVYDVLKPVLIEKAKAEEHLKVHPHTTQTCTAANDHHCFWLVFGIVLLTTTAGPEALMHA